MGHYWRRCNVRYTSFGGEARSDCRITLGTHCRLHGRHQAIFDVLEKADESARRLMTCQVDRTAKKATPISKEDEEEY